MVDFGFRGKGLERKGGRIYSESCRINQGLRLLQVPAEDAVVYHVDRVRRPIAEGKAIARAVDMIKVGCSLH